MDCPRCGTRLSRISLGGAESVYCEQCRFADVESDHTRASTGEETWDDALTRFRTAGAAATDTDAGAASDAPDTANRAGDAGSTDEDGAEADDADTTTETPESDATRPEGEAEEA